MRARAVVAMASVVAGGCVSVTTKTSYSEDLVRRDSRVTPIPDSSSYSATPTLEGQMLVLEISRAERCRIEVTPVYHKVAHHVRSAAGDARGTAFEPQYTAFYGLALAGLGAYSYLDADGLAANSADMSSGSGSSSPSDFQALGITLVAVGALVGVVALIDHERLQNSDDDLGTVTRDPETSEAECHVRKLSGVRVTLSLDGQAKWSSDALTDAHGLARVALGELPEDAFRSGALQFQLAVESSNVPVVLPRTDTSRLADLLLADSTSRFARDREAFKAASCQQKVDRAKAHEVTIDTSGRELQSIEGQWSQARQACGDKWTDEDEQASVAFRAEVDKTAKQRAENACQEAVRISVAELEARKMQDQPSALDIEAELGPVRDRCKDVPDGDKQIATAAEAARQAREDDTRRQKRAAAIEVLNAKLQAHDAVGVQQAITSNAEARTALVHDENSVSIAVGLADFWISAVARNQTQQGILQLCASRAVVRAVAGDVEWTRLRSGAIEHLGVVAGNKVAHVMDGCK